MTLNHAFNDLQAAFADLAAIQGKIEVNRAAARHFRAGSQAWFDLDKAFNALQGQWDESYRRFKSAMKQFNARCTSVIPQVYGRVAG